MKKTIVSTKRLIAAIERAERINGVKEAKYNPRTRELTILYDAHRTSILHIKHAVA